MALAGALEVWAAASTAGVHRGSGERVGGVMGWSLLLPRQEEPLVYSLLLLLCV